jgi:hypothetical protein
VPLTWSNLPTNLADGNAGHTAGHNTTNSAANALAAYVDTLPEDGDIATAVAAKQPLDADLTTIAALDSTTAGALATDGSGWVRKTYAQLKTALGLAKADVGLGNVDNTADTAKPISTAQQTALDRSPHRRSLALPPGSPRPTSDSATSTTPPTPRSRLVRPPRRRSI